MMVFIELWDCTHTEGQNKQKAVSVILHSPLVNFIPLTITSKSISALQVLTPRGRDM